MPEPYPILNGITQDPTIKSEGAYWDEDRGNAALANPYGITKRVVQQPGMDPMTVMETPERPNPFYNPNRSTVEDKILKELPQGGYSSMDQYSRKLIEKTHEFAQENGIDINSPEGSQWYQRTVDEGINEGMKLGYVHPPDPKMVKEMDGVLIDIRTGRKIYDANQAYQDSQQPPAGQSPKIPDYYNQASLAPIQNAPQPPPQPAQDLDQKLLADAERVLKTKRPNSPEYQKAFSDRNTLIKNMNEKAAKNLENIDPGQPDESGKYPDVLNGVSSGDAATVKKLVNYEIPLPSGMALKTPEWRRTLALAAQYDPSFDAKQYENRKKILQDFSSGKTSQAIQSLNTAIPHLKTLKEKVEALNNYDTQFLNKIKNGVSTQFGDKRMAGLETAATAVEDELATVFKNTGATDVSIKAWREKFDGSKSPAQLKEAIDTAIELLGGRMGAIKGKWDSSIPGKSREPLLNEKSRKILEGLGVDLTPVDFEKKEENAPRGTNTPKGQSQANSKPQGGMIRVQAPNGKTGSFPANKPLPKGYKQIQ